MGHQLNPILRALRVLQEAAIRGDVPRPTHGVCANLDTIGEGHWDAYDFVQKHSDDWEHAMHWGDDVGALSGKLRAYFVPDVEGVGQWEGANLDLRLDLIEFLIEKCEAVLTR